MQQVLQSRPDPDLPPLRDLTQASLVFSLLRYYRTVYSYHLPFLSGLLTERLEQVSNKQ